MNPSQLIIPLLACACVPATAATFVFNPNLAIPDNSIVGVSNTQTISVPAGFITNVKLSLNIAGTPNASNAFNGDFYAYLQHSSGFSVLLDRTGRRHRRGAG